MALEAANVPALKLHCSSSSGGSRSARSRVSASDPCEPLRLLCGQLAERAAHLEVLLGLLAELMVGHLMVSENIPHPNPYQIKTIQKSQHVPWPCWFSWYL